MVSVELTGRWSKGGAKTKGSASVQGGDPDGPAESCGETSSLCRVPADIPTWEEGDHGALSFSTQGSPWGPHREATFSPWEDDLKTEPPGAASPAGWSTDSKDHRAPRRERRKMIEKDILHKVTWDARGPACSDRNPVEEAMAGLRPETPPEGPREGPLVLSLKVGKPLACASFERRSLEWCQPEAWPTAPVLVWAAVINSHRPGERGLNPRN